MIRGRYVEILQDEQASQQWLVGAQPTQAHTHASGSAGVASRQFSHSLRRGSAPALFGSHKWRPSARAWPALKLAPAGADEPELQGPKPSLAATELALVQLERGPPQAGPPVWRPITWWCRAALAHNDAIHDQPAIVLAGLGSTSSGAGSVRARGGASPFSY
jgi:hypothetical protein